MNQKNRGKRKKQLVFMGTAAVVLSICLVIIIMALRKQAEESPVQKETEKEVQTLTAEHTGEEEKEEPVIDEAVRQAAESDKIQLHLEGYMKSIFGGWEWVMQEALTSYGKEHQIQAKNAVVLSYTGYDAGTDTHSFYLQLDDEEGTILLGTYHPYEAKIEPADKTLEKIRKEKEAVGDKGEEETGETLMQTLEPTKTPEVLYTDMQIRDVPVTLAEFLGEDAPDLPTTLAGYLVSQGREGDTCATYAGNLNIGQQTAEFDLQLADETIIHVTYNGEFAYEIR